jgi:hypothetical protein
MLGSAKRRGTRQTSPLTAVLRRTRPIRFRMPLWHATPISDAALARHAAVDAIRDELPRVLADIGVFINDPDDRRPSKSY